MRGIRLLAEKMLASQERLFPIQFVSWLLSWLVVLLFSKSVSYSVIKFVS